MYTLCPVLFQLCVQLWSSPCLVYTLSMSSQCLIWVQSVFWCANLATQVFKSACLKKVKLRPTITIQKWFTCLVFIQCPVLVKFLTNRRPVSVQSMASLCPVFVLFDSSPCPVRVYSMSSRVKSVSSLFTVHVQSTSSLSQLTASVWYLALCQM